MNNKIGREHPHQQIKDGETAARMALEEVLKLPDKDTGECVYNPNYVFGAWYLEFLLDMRKAAREGGLFTREAGEAQIMNFFHPSPKEAKRREREEDYDRARRELDERVAAKRKETGCYAQGKRIKSLTNVVRSSRVVYKGTIKARRLIKWHFKIQVSVNILAN
jgi:hypothetical protein